MPIKDLLHDHHVVSGLYPVADAFATSATTDFVSLKDYRRVTFIIHTGDATAGTADGTVTLLASAVAAGTSTTALAFSYRSCASSASVDTWGNYTEAAAAGFSMTAGDNYIYIVEVSADDLEATSAGKYFVAVKVTEVTNDPVVASCICILSEPRYPGLVPVQAIA